MQNQSHTNSYASMCTVLLQLKLNPNWAMLGLFDKITVNLYGHFWGKLLQVINPILADQIKVILYSFSDCINLFG